MIVESGPVAVVLHAQRTAYGVVRSVANLGGTTVVADVEATPLFASRLVSEAILIPPLKPDDSQSLLEALCEIGRNYMQLDGKPVLFSGRDDYTIFFAENSEVLSTYFAFSSEHRLEHLRRVTDKTCLPALAGLAGVKVPKTMTQEAGDSHILASLSLPVIVKPAIKNEPHRSAEKSAFRLRVCHTREELLDALTLLRSACIRFVAQELVDGNDTSLFTVGVFARDGVVTRGSVAQKLRQFPPGNGECSLGQTVEDPGLLQQAQAVVGAAELSGIAQLEFKRDSSGMDFLIEINPRVWSWHEIHRFNGADLVGAALGQPALPTTQGSMKRVRWHFFWMDLLHNVILERNVGVWDFLFEALKSKLQAFWAPRDPGVFFRHSVSSIRFIRRYTSTSTSKQHC